MAWQSETERPALHCKFSEYVRQGETERPVLNCKYTKYLEQGKSCVLNCKLYMEHGKFSFSFAFRELNLVHCIAVAA